MLNQQQQSAVDSTHNKILCLAGAGTGKTQTMIARVSRIIQAGVSHKNVLVLTFTNAAALEMRQRFENTNNGLAPTFSTFHAFCYQLISSDIEVLQSLGYSEVPTLPTESEVKYLETKVKKDLNIKLSSKQLDGTSALSLKDQFQYDIFWKRITQSLKSSNFITFDIMLEEVCQLFVKDESIIQKYKKQYQYILVDEFQDTDPKQWEFVKSFENSNLFIVGDAKQAIYQFRGADSSIIKSLAESPEWQTIKLYQNYRSSKQICGYANDIHISDAGSAYYLNIDSDKNGMPVNIQAGVKTEYINENLNELLKNIDHAMSIYTGDCAILVRTNAESKVIKDSLKTMNIPYGTNQPSEYVANLLRGAMDETYAADWIANRLTTPFYTKYIRHSAIDSSYRSLAGVSKLFSNCGDVITQVSKIKLVSNILNSSLAQGEKLFILLDVFNITTNNVVNLTDYSNESIIEYITEICKPTKNFTLYVGTIHSVKGLEFDVVHLLGVEGKSFTIDSEEMRNLYYVGCTRAKNLLHVYIG